MQSLSVHWIILVALFLNFFQLPCGFIMVKYHDILRSLEQTSHLTSQICYSDTYSGSKCLPAQQQGSQQFKSMSRVTEIASSEISWADLVRYSHLILFHCSWHIWEVRSPTSVWQGNFRLRNQQGDSLSVDLPETESRQGSCCLNCVPPRSLQCLNNIRRRGWISQLFCQKVTLTCQTEEMKTQRALFLGSLPIRVHAERAIVAKRFRHLTLWASMSCK